MGDFYGTGIEIWAGFGPFGISEKKTLADYEQKKVKKNNVKSALEKLHKMKVKKYFFFLKNSIMHFK